ncbi:hypothetical protein CEXT_589111 [Caerostris extrusa]|uniref:Uncharacterized protein n=1 Tax=Caerostris extrusa TaxID=172846 RepID=A0AAV4NBZ1_CAEEX|nr:hypothetical protein CEXT_589111 [Caerostris extrusa]
MLVPNCDKKWMQIPSSVFEGDRELAMNSRDAITQCAISKLWQNAEFPCGTPYQFCMGTLKMVCGACTLLQSSSSAMEESPTYKFERANSESKNLCPSFDEVIPAQQEAKKECNFAFLLIQGNKDTTEYFNKNEQNPFCELAKEF